MHDACTTRPTTLLAIALAFAVTPICWANVQEDSTPEFGESVELIQRAQATHAALPGGRVVIATSVRNKDTEVTAPPTRGAFGFLRETKDGNARLRSECWSGPDGGLDLISDGTTLFIGDPIRRTYRTRNAPATIGEYLKENETASLLGVGPGLLMSWLADGEAVFQPTTLPRRTLVNERAAYAIEGIAPSPEGGVTVEFSFSAGEKPLLLSARLPMPNGSVVEISYSEWEPRISEQSFFASAFELTPRPNWQHNESTGVFGSKASKSPRNDAPVRALVGKLAPKIAASQAGHPDDIDQVMRDHVCILLFWSNTEAMGREALDAIEQTTHALDDFGAKVLAIQLDDGVAKPGTSSAITYIKGDSQAIFSAWRLSGMPTVAVIDAKGIVRAVQVGYPGKDKLTQRLLATAKKLAPNYASVSE